MRVCILTDYYYPQLGGITEHVHGQAVNLAARGHEVTILTGRLPHAPRAADRDERVLAADDVELVHMGAGAAALRQRLADAAHRASARHATAAPLLRRAAFDVVHIHAPYNPSFFMLAPVRAPRRARSASARTTPSSRRGACATSCMRPTRASLSRLHGHVVVSEACIPPLDHYFPEFDWRVIPNGIDEDHFAPGRRADRGAARRAATRSSSSSGASIPATGSGSCSRRSSGLWRARGGGVRLCVVGDGPLRRYYERRLAPDVAPRRCTGRDASTGTGRATTRRPTSSARPASGRASAWCCSRR